VNQAGLTSLGYVHARAGHRRDAERAVKTLLDAPSPRADWVAAILLALGRREQALACLQRAVIERQPLLMWMRAEPLLDEVRDTPEFHALASRIGPSPRG
jgi:hypothetical protein